MILHDVCPIDERGSPGWEEGALIGRQQESRCEAAMSQNRAMERRKKTEKEMAGFNVEREVPLGVLGIEKLSR
jgi:hypothetical protein